LVAGLGFVTPAKDPKKGDSLFAIFRLEDQAGRGSNAFFGRSHSVVMFLMRRGYDSRRRRGQRLAMKAPFTLIADQSQLPLTERFSRKPES